MRDLALNRESSHAQANSLLSGIGRLRYWVSYIAGGRATFSLITIAAGIYGVLLRTSSLGRSLWLDEAWVANSVSAHSLAGMFYYDDWLQSSPPLFLVLVRAAVGLFGLSNKVLRAVPSALGMLAIVLMLVFVLRVLSRQYALLAWLLLVLSPVAANYSRMLKQYSAELAATTAILLACALYIEKASARRFWLLVALVAVGLLSGYAVAFLLPGIALMMWMSPVRRVNPSDDRICVASAFARALLFTVIAAGILIGEYCVFVIPNSPTTLRADWAEKNARVTNFAALAASESYQFIGELPLNHRFQDRTIRLAAVGFTLAAGLLLAWLRFRNGRRKWLAIQIVCLSPCALLIICDWFNWYPFTERTTLFALPCLIALVVSSLQLMFLFLVRRRRDWSKPLIDVMVLGAVAVTLVAGRSQNYRSISPVEDMDGATAFLRTHVRPNDFLWVHASCTEAFRLYARMSKWEDPPAHFGQTGWPCCARGIEEDGYRSSEGMVRVDFGNALPRDFSGRVWLLYTTRPEHWHGFADEPQIMQAILRDRGCTQTTVPAPTFRNIGVVSFDCQSGDSAYFVSQLSQSSSWRK
jgi:Dolichyl-phosphate-mannose-protein mannosyltransferase